MPNKIDKKEQSTWPGVQILSWRGSLGGGGVSAEGIDFLVE
jgi:hypothetical protein